MMDLVRCGRRHCDAAKLARLCFLALDKDALIERGNGKEYMRKARVARA